jgi:hypothetical protein
VTLAGATNLIEGFFLGLDEDIRTLLLELARGAPVLAKGSLEIELSTPFVSRVAYC